MICQSDDASMRVVRGSTYNRQVIVPFDLTGYDAELVIKHRYDDRAAVITLTSSPAAGLTVNTPEILIRIGADVTPTLTQGSYVYTLRVVQSADHTEATVLLNDKVHVTATAL